jgi:hypothetical protein
MAASRPTVVYLVMLGCSVFGLWAILAMGRNLKPPPDLSGQWQLTRATSEPAKTSSTMQVEQSGRFFQITFENSPAFGMQLTDASKAGNVAMRGKSITMEFSGLDTPDSAQIVVNAPHDSHDGTWIIHRLKQSVARGGH